jgi:D-alanyl-D-alanine carboxypeptidase/D-alanyl-D-alanine-endopeptidase (penicillin-binding protein 4)
MKIKTIIIFVILIAGRINASEPGYLQSKIDLILKNVPRSTKYGIMIYNPLTKETLYRRNIEETIKPASNTKLFTSGVALSLLGSDYELSTKLFTDDNNITDGTINGNLYLKGFGNSLFTDNDIDTLVMNLRTLGIKEITGNIIGDDSYFDSVYHRKDWIEDEMSSVPLSPVSAMVINRNKLNFYLTAPGKVNSRVNYEMSPYCPEIKVINNAQSTRRRSSVSVRELTSNDSYEFVISGGLRKNGTSYISTDINNPPLFAAIILYDRLLKAGIKVIGKPMQGITPLQADEIDSRSITLKYLLKVINKHSDNYLAECLFKTIGAEFSDEQGNAFYATQAVLSFIKDNDIYSGGTSIVDGSGLSHYNQVTVRTIVELLEKIYFNPLIYQDYYNSLSVAGEDGTLRGRMINTKADNNFHGKTGTLNGVIALSGYLKSSEGSDLIVSIIFEFNRGSAIKYKHIQDQIIDLLTGL